MRNIFCPILLITLNYHFAIGQNEIPAKETLKKKYQKTDVKREIKKNFLSTSAFPDSIVVNPLQFVNTFVYIHKDDFEFSSISVDVDVKTNIPNDYQFYISPLCGSINKMQFYCGIITGLNGARDGIFTRWMERDKAAIKTTGNSSSSDNEGDYIQVTHKFKWNKGKYRIRLIKSEYTKGKPIPKNFTREDLMFTWGEYEHSWVTMEIEDLTTHQKTNIGSLAFPGKNLWFSARNIIFLEHYGSAINFAKKHPKYSLSIMDYKDLPFICVDMENIVVNGKKITPVSVKTHHNFTHNPNQSKIAMPIPLLSKAGYDKENGIIHYEVGKFLRWYTPKD